MQRVSAELEGEGVSESIQSDAVASVEEHKRALAKGNTVMYLLSLNSSISVINSPHPRRPRARLT